MYRAGIEADPRWDSSAKPISVLTIGHRSAGLLEECLASMEAHCRGRQWELVLVLNGASTEVVSLAREWRASVPTLLVTIPEARPGAARSVGVSFCRGDVVLFLDDDITVDHDIVAEVERIFRDPSVTAAGGPNLTPPGSGPLERASGAVMESRIGAGRMSRRYRPSSREKDVDEHSLILCNLAVRRGALLQAGAFPHVHLVSNEENLLLQGVARNGGRMVSSPELSVFHRRRDTWKGIARQAAKYGEGRAQNMILLPETAHPRYYLPSMLLFSVAVAPWWSLPLAFYGSAVLAAAVASAWKTRDPRLLVLFPPVCAVVHWSYGWAFLRGMARWLWQRERLREALE